MRVLIINEGYTVVPQVNNYCTLSMNITSSNHRQYREFRKKYKLEKYKLQEKIQIRIIPITQGGLKSLEKNENTMYARTTNGMLSC